MVNTNLIQIFDIKKGDIISFIGGGGKSSCIFSLAKELMLNNITVIITTTTKMHLPQIGDDFRLTKIITPKNIKEDLLRDGYSFVAKKFNDIKCTGISEKELLAFLPLCDVMLIEADGSAGNPIKIPNATEPVIIDFSNRVIGVIGLSALGKTLEESCFRYGQISHNFPYSKSSIIDERIMADIATSKNGYLRNICGMIPLYFLNQADRNQEVIKAKNVAKYINEKEKANVIIGSLKKGRFYEYKC